MTRRKPRPDVHAYPWYVVEVTPGRIGDRLINSHSTEADACREARRLTVTTGRTYAIARGVVAYRPGYECVAYGTYPNLGGDK